MFSDVEMDRDVAICAEHLKGHSPPHQQILILTNLLRDLKHEQACKEHGFYLAITALKSIGNNNNNTTNDDNHILIFPVSFTCRTFFPAKGDILEGTVMRILYGGGENGAATGAFIKSGPLRYAYLSYLKMPGYQFVTPKSEEEEPCFQKDDLTKIAVGIVVRFVVLDRRFKESPEKMGSNDVWVLGSLDGDDTLGPVSLTWPYM